MQTLAAIQDTEAGNFRRKRWKSKARPLAEDRLLQTTHFL